MGYLMALRHHITKADTPIKPPKTARSMANSMVSFGLNGPSLREWPPRYGPTSEKTPQTTKVIKIASDGATQVEARCIQSGLGVFHHVSINSQRRRIKEGCGLSQLMGSVVSCDFSHRVNLFLVGFIPDVVEPFVVTRINADNLPSNK
jgi:hypothetical protein